MPDSKTTDRELGELLNEIRVALPGVQVLFAFLLSVPFSQRFTQLGPDQKRIFYLAFLSSALSSSLLIAPSVFARLTWRHHDKERLLQVSNILCIVGCVALAVGIGCVVWVVSDLAYHSAVAATATAIVVAVITVTWFALPLYDRMRRRGDPAAGSQLVVPGSVRPQMSAEGDRRSDPPRPPSS
ncbi:MAG: DUF6328 family protein [Acidimicrobiales bacterium]